MAYAAESEGVTVTRAFKINRFDPHPRKKIIIVNGEITISVINNLGDDLLAEEIRDYKKIIRLDNLSEKTDMEELIEEILESCPFIEDESVKSQIIPVIEILKIRRYDKSGNVIFQREANSTISTEEAGISLEMFKDFSDYFEEDILIENDSESDLTEINMVNLDKYVELLYEEISEKAKGARFIYRLCQMPENLNPIISHETALNAIFRTLREDYKKSMYLTTNLLGICKCYAQFIDFHYLLNVNKVCSVSVDIIEYEMNRYSKGLEQIQGQIDEAKERNISSAKKKHLDKMKEKFFVLSKKQDNLLKVAFEVVLFLSEEKAFQSELIKRGIIKHLVLSLERKHTELLVIALNFLKNISLISEAKGLMNQFQIIEKIAKLVEPSNTNELISICLRLIYNLTFDTKLRHKMVKTGLLNKICAFFGDPGLQPNCLNIFYLMSMDKLVRPKFSGTNIVNILMKLIFANPKKTMDIELAALGINLSANKKCAILMCENDGIKLLLIQAFDNQDVLIMKILRNISHHEGEMKQKFIDFSGDLANALRKATIEDFTIECVGILTNLTIALLDWNKILKKFQLVSWIKAKLQTLGNLIQNGSFNDSFESTGLDPEEMLLEIIAFIGTCCSDPEAGDQLVRERIIETLHLFYHSRLKNSQIKLQILFVFYKLSVQEKTRNFLVEKTNIPELLFDLLHDSELQIRDLCEATLDMIGEYNEEWKGRVKSERFSKHNEHWLEMVKRDSFEERESSTLIRSLSRGILNSANQQGTELLEKYREYGDEDDEDVLQHPCSASENLISDSDTEDSHLPDKNDFMHPRGKSMKIETSVFDRFKHQYEQEMLDKERYEYGISEDEEGDDDGGDGESDTRHNINERNLSSRRYRRSLTSGNLSSRQSLKSSSSSNSLKTLQQQQSINDNY